MQKYNEIPSPLTFEWLSQNAKRELLASREMEFALAESIYEEKYFDMKLNKIFAEDYPNSLKNAIKLTFGYYLESKTKEKKPHIQTLLDFIKEMPMFSVFHENYCSIKGTFDARTMKAEETWQKIKGVRFEKALVAMEILYLKIFLPSLGKIHEYDDNALELQDYFIDAASDYLNRTKEHWKPIDKNLWKDELKLYNRIYENFISLLDDEELLEKIKNHIFALMDVHLFRYTVCEPFISDKSFRYNIESRTCSCDNAENMLCNTKNQLLSDYYLMKNERLVATHIKHSKEEDFDFLREENISTAPIFMNIPMLMEYFGIKEKFIYNGKTYNLPKLIASKGMLDEHVVHEEIEELHDFYQENSEDMPFEDILDDNGLPLRICKFSELDNSYQNDGEGFRLLGADVGNGEQRIDLNLHNLFYCGQSDLCVIFFHAKCSGAMGRFAMLNLMKKEGKRNNNENILLSFKEFHGFVNAKIVANHNSKGVEIDIAIYKDKTLVLVGLELIYGVANFKEEINFEKCLIAAGHNLNKIIAALQTEPELLAEITGNGKVKFEDLKIETMLIGDSFEFDSQKFQGHKKFSLLELMVALNDDVSDLVMFSPKVTSNFEENGKLNLDISDLVLYNTDKPSMEDFFKALNSDIWKKVLAYWK